MDGTIGGSGDAAALPTDGATGGSGDVPPEGLPDGAAPEEPGVRPAGRPADQSAAELAADLRRAAAEQSPRGTRGRALSADGDKPARRSRARKSVPSSDSDSKRAPARRSRADSKTEEKVPFETLEELARLRLENADLRQKVVELQGVVDSQIVAAGAAAPDNWLARWHGPGTMLYAPHDLFILYSVKLAECMAYYGFSYIYVEYLSEEFGFTDEEAGDIYSAYGFLCTVVGLILGLLIDRMGVRKSMILGCTCSTIARGICFATTSKKWIWFSQLTFAPVGAAFGVPVLALGVRRYTHEENRSFAFSFFYAVLCLACLCGSLLINIVRDFVGPETTASFLGYELTWMRVVVFWCTVCTSYTIVAAFFCRDIVVLSDQPLKSKEYCVYKPAPLNVRKALNEVLGQSRFWRLAAVTLIFCGVRMTFRHLDATFPKYFVRTYGPQAPFELILCVNPIVTMVAAPFVTGYLISKKIGLMHTLLIGSFISGISVFALAAQESYLAAIVFVIILSVGEATWSPKLYEFSTMSAPEGREGMFVAITAAPMYLASVPVGILSGVLLRNYCPRDSTPEERQTQLMWFIIGLTSFSSPVLLFCLRSRLFRPEDEEQLVEKEEVGEGEHRRPGKTRLPGSEKLGGGALPTTIGTSTKGILEDDEGLPFRQ